MWEVLLIEAGGMMVLVEELVSSLTCVISSHLRPSHQQYNLMNEWIGKVVPWL